MSCDWQTENEIRVKLFPIPFIFVLLLIVFWSFVLPVYASDLDHFEGYLSPKPGAEWVQPGESVAIRPLNAGPNWSLGSWEVSSSDGEVVSGFWHRSQDGSTAFFAPQTEFQLGETYHVSLECQVDGNLQAVTWSFTVRPACTQKVLSAMEEYQASLFDFDEGQYAAESDEASWVEQSLDMPPRMPSYTLYSTEGASESNLYMIAREYPRPGEYTYHYVLDKTNQVEYYTQNPYWYEFFVPYDVEECYVIFKTSHFMIYDTTSTFIRAVTIQGGYSLDFHDFQFLPDGHFLFFGYEYRENVDLSEIVDGGNPEATVIGTVVQELDSEDNVLFQWRSLDEDELLVTDVVDDWIDLTDETVDYMHTNSVTKDQDGDIVISVRHMSQIMKLDYETATLEWRFGNVKNDFNMLTEEHLFNMQHDARILDNGHLMLFDNGTRTLPLENRYARVLEYALDEENMTAELVWSYDHNKEIYSEGRGSSRRLANGNTIISWGSVNEGFPHATEIDSDNNIVWELTLDPIENSTNRWITYQVHRSNLTIHKPIPSLIYDDAKNGWVVLYFAKFGDESVSKYKVEWGSGPSLLYNELLTTSTSESLYVLNFTSDTMYAQVTAVYQNGSMSAPSELLGIDLSTLGLDDDETSVELPGRWITVKNWPNPFNDATTICFTMSESGSVSFELFDLLGRRVWVRNMGYVSAGERTISFTGDNLSSGVYLLRARNGAGAEVVQRITLVK